jgi:hypothetical protein
MPSVGFYSTYQGVIRRSVCVIAIDVKKFSCYVTRVTVKILALLSTIITLFVYHLSITVLRVINIDYHFLTSIIELKSPGLRMECSNQVINYVEIRY